MVLSDRPVIPDKWSKKGAVNFLLAKKREACQEQSMMICQFCHGYHGSEQVIFFFPARIPFGEAGGHVSHKHTIYHEENGLRPVYMGNVFFKERG